MRPIFKILIAVGVIALLGFGFYFGWQMIIGGEETTSLPTLTGLEGLDDSNIPTLPVADGVELPVVRVATNEPVMNQISEVPVSGFLAHGETNQVYYFTPRGQVFNVKAGVDLELSSQDVGEIRSFLADADHEKALASFGDNAKSLQWGVFDVVDGVWRPLPSDIIEATWGEDNEELFAIVRDGEDRDLVRINLFDLAAPYEVLVRNFGILDVTLDSFSGDKIIITERPSVDYAGSMWDFSPRTKRLTSLLSSQRGLMFSSQRNRDTAFIYSSPNTFSVVDSTLQPKFPIFFTTLPHKCTTPDGVKIYCFVPGVVPNHVVLPDDYLQRSFFSRDILYEVNIESGEILKRVSSGDDDFDEFDAIFPHSVDDSLYFINRYNNHLYQINFPVETKIE